MRTASHNIGAIVRRNHSGSFENITSDTINESCIGFEYGILVHRAGGTPKRVTVENDSSIRIAKGLSSSIHVD